MPRTSVLASVLLATAVGAGAIVSGQQDSAGIAGTATTPGNIWRPAQEAIPGSPALSPEDEMRTFSLPPGYRVELVAAEPLLESPTMIDFDADGRLWALELKGFLPDMGGRDSMEPINNVVVLEDTNGDGRMDKRTVFADGLIMPRALKVLDHGVLVGEPPNMWLMKDTDGDLKADTKELVVDTFGNRNGGIEHNANGTLWAMDNVMYSSEHAWNLEYRDGVIKSVPSLSRGQWQGSQDDAGRVYRNVNDSPLFVDYTPASYFLRNDNAARTRGLYELLIEQADATIYPVRQNRGVNRGYRDPFFRKDGSSIVIQGAGTPTIYRGDKYPAELQGAALITDSPTNLVHAMRIVDDGTGKLSAVNVFPRGEFFASSDERSRPVNLFSGPDGYIYIVDLYRGVVQAGGIWSDYLTSYIKGHDLQLPVGRGRIWRVVYGDGPVNRERPALSSATPAQLVEALAHPNGWWRDTAQRLLVERNPASAVPSLARLAASAPDWRTRLHALWTLNGMGAISPDVITGALGDQNDNVRAAAVRISEPWLEKNDNAIISRVLPLTTDASWTVRRQLAASLGSLPAAARVKPATEMLAREGGDAIVVDALISGLNGLEANVLEGVFQAQSGAGTGQPTEAVAMLAAAVTKSGDLAAIQKLLDRVTDERNPEWQRAALLEGLDAALPSGGGRGRRGGGLAGLSAPGGRVTVVAGRAVTLPTEHLGLSALANGSGALADRAKSVWNKLEWPGRPEPVVVVVTAHGGGTAAICRRRGDLQKPLHGLPHGRWPRQGKARR